MRKLFVLLLIGLLTAMMMPTAEAQFCEGVLYSNLIPGDTAIVVVDEGVLNARSEPSLSSDLLAQLEPDTLLMVLDGPVCADGNAWYELSLDGERTGWAAESSSDEYWLGRMPRQYTTYEHPADPNGTSPTLRFIYPETAIERIDFDSAVMLGDVYTGDQIILRPLGGEPIFITVVPFEDFEMYVGGYDRAEVLQDLVAEWSDVALDWAYAYPNSQGDWPTIVVQKNLEEFQNGRGFSYIAAYINRDEFEPVDENSFWFAFHGVTDDGAYFVDVTTPIQTPELPEGPPYDSNDLTEYFAGYSPWLKEIEAFLLPQAGASFSPMLGMVKSIVYSLEIE